MRLRRQGTRLVLWVEAWPRWFGKAGFVLVMATSIGFGIVRGGHGPDVIAWLDDARHMAANAAGFRITAVALTGQKHLTRDEVLAIAGVTGHTSLLFLDAAAARTRLEESPWIGEATVQKLYPDKLAIDIKERNAFALWQKEGQVGVIASDGTVLEPFVSPDLVALPFVVGKGAETRARTFLAELSKVPAIREQVRASVLVGERRWNVLLANGVEVKLPETGVARALDHLARLDREKNLLARDITVVDLRMPGRVTVRLSDRAAEAREEALKPKKKKGGNA
ncbi:cell division protein FtsQ/DivIB [Rhodovulum sp. PH10]|uniref:cell division protein FtsQ/DivIB n=1 Tax=Rhodovulum sp. PH10 TaxID=1187851 RepID=UPI00192A8D35|nr:cell division protein FtsQ/DivIB [Rhodovulum sp. PH10]